MIHPIPSGTRDVLPDEMRELREIADAVRGACERHGYGELSTPALEYEQVILRGDPASAAPAYRLFDERGDVLVLRTDMTIPIARVVATRYADAEPPLRFCYVASAYRVITPQRGQPRELLQTGIELIGAPAPDGTAEAINILCAALDAAGLQGYRIGLGDASLYPALLESLEVPQAARDALLHELQTRDFVGLEREARALDLPAEARERLARLPQTRGGAEVLDAPGTEGLRALYERLAPSVQERVIFDLGLSRPLSYYTGAVFEVYDAAIGTPIGGGGRYDDLIGRFGAPQPAVGWGLGLERLHLAVVGERRARS